MSLLGVAASATAGLGLQSARAQEGVWQEYRRDDLGFRIELPGMPKVEVEEGDDITVRSTDVALDHDRMILGAHCMEYKKAEDARTELGRGNAMRATGMSTTGESALVMNGFPARQFIRESDGGNYIRRVVVMDNLAISVMVVGDRSIHSNVTVRRFLDSFKLLRLAR
jgi:hypothetical protein